MINGFFHTIQHDLINVVQAIRNETPRDRAQNERVTISALRIFASGIMGSGALTAISTISFFATAPVSAVLTATIGVGLYAIGHDVFLLSKRFQENNVEDYRVGQSPIEQFTEETFFQPIWVHLLSRIRRPT